MNAPAPRGRRPGRHAQAGRVLRLYMHLEGRRTGVRLSHLARELDVSERQMRRDLACVERAGVPVAIDLDDERRSTVWLGRVEVTND